MKTLSLKLDDNIFQEAEKVLVNMKMPRNRYINEAVEYYNKLQRRKFLEAKLQKESKLCRESSMEVLKEFEAIDFDYEAI
jgi:antitoxin component of RelBE/YafQ-DinJ toxin-antitoxin module